HLEQMRQTARMQNEATSLRAQLDSLRRERERLRLKTAQAAEHLSSLDIELGQLTQGEEALRIKIVDARQAFIDRRQECELLRERSEQIQHSLAETRGQRAGLVSRIEVLEGLERSHEGLDSGVREVFDLVGRPDPGPWKNVLGIVADFLSASRENA